MLTSIPRFQKGAIIGMDPFNPAGSIVVFQFNPDTISRSLSASVAAGAGGGAPEGTTRLAGPPQETIKLDIMLDATDQLQLGDPVALAHGVTPQLAALEMLLYPRSTLIFANEILARAGIIEVIPPEAPLAILVWGPKRVVPVRLTEFSITEEMYDPDLNPIHAKVSLGMRVLNYRDLGLLSPGGGIFMAHQVMKEGLAKLNTAVNGASLLRAMGI